MQIRVVSEQSGGKKRSATANIRFDLEPGRCSLQGRMVLCKESEGHSLRPIRFLCAPHFMGYVTHEKLPIPAQIKFFMLQITGSSGT